jgi:hypothetical protein
MSPRIQLPDDAEPADGIVTSPREQERVEPEPVATVDVPRERRLGKIAGGSAVLSVLLTIAAVPIGARDIPARQGESNDRTLLLDIGQSGTGQLTAMWMRVASLMLIIGMMLFLYRAISQRQPSHASYIPLIGAIAIVIVSIGTAIGFFEVREVARDFVASQPQTLDRAETLLDEARDTGLLRATNIGQILGGLMLGVWISLTSLEGMRVGLLTRFLGIFGIGTGLASAVGIPVSAALFIGWFGSVAVLALGYWPGGRPPAWDEGRAVGWDEADRRDYAERRARREG